MKSTHLTLCLLLIGCVTGKSAYVPEDIALKSNRGIKVSAVEITADSSTDRGTRDWKREEAETGLQARGRYIGYELRVENQADSQVIKKGTYPSHHARTFMVDSFGGPILIGNTPIRHCGQPGIVCVLLGTLAENEEFETAPHYQDISTPTQYRDPVLISGTKYRAGGLLGLMVDFPYEDFVKLVKEGTPVQGRLAFYRRGGFHSKVYDTYSFKGAADYTSCELSFGEKLDADRKKRWCIREARQTIEDSFSKAKISPFQQKQLEEVRSVLDDIEMDKLSSSVMIRRVTDANGGNPALELVFQEHKPEQKR